LRRNATRIRTWTRAGRRQHHLIDPATGTSTATGIAAVVAAANDAWWAEGIAKAIIVGGIDGATELATGAHVHAWLFLESGEIVEIGDEQ
jgi:thiamine biosynthesis lipoprotein ApbE